MNERRDRVVALALRAGAYSSFALVLAGLLISYGIDADIGIRVSHLGLIFLLATPALRIVVTFVLFLRDRDRKYSLITAGVLLIVLLSSFLSLRQ
jgi:uncharacterized membrane protein